MRRLTLIIAVALFFGSAHTNAAEEEAKLLIQGCAEVEAIYNRRGERQLLAGITTSVAEAMRAGYCKGVLEQHARTSSCSQADWVSQAQRIARTSISEAINVTYLLRRSCAN